MHIWVKTANMLMNGLKALIKDKTIKNKDKMAKIINTKVSEKADFKIEDGVIRDSSIADWSGVHLYGNSELKKVTICGDVEIENSILENCKLTSCSVKNSTIRNININKDYCAETITNGEIFVPAGSFECKVYIDEDRIIVRFRIFSNVWNFAKHEFLGFIKGYYKL